MTAQGELPGDLHAFRRQRPRLAALSVGADGEQAGRLQLGHEDVQLGSWVPWSAIG